MLTVEGAVVDDELIKSNNGLAQKNLPGGGAWSKKIF
jgi:hypothetical protein